MISYFNKDNIDSRKSAYICNKIVNIWLKQRNQK